MQPEKFQDIFNVPRETIEKFQIYEALLIKWQKAINLVGASTLTDIWGRHFADSAILSKLIPAGQIIADLGSGAGFPGIVLKILKPGLDIHLIESDERKSLFLKTVSRETDIPIIIHNERAEAILASIKPGIVTARAFAPLNEIIFIIKAIPDVKAYLFKGRNYEQELELSLKTYKFHYKVHENPVSRESFILEISNITG